MESLFEVLQTSHLIECSHILHRTIPTWPGDIDFYRCPLATYQMSGYAKEYFILPEGFGTHMDSPAHFFSGMRTTTDISPKELIARCVLINVTEKCAANPDYELQVDDVLHWESLHGPIQPGSLVCMRTGWDLKFSTPELYRSANAIEPHPAYPGGTMHFPGFSKEVAELLCAHREIVGIGIDTLSLDPGTSVSFPVHQVILKADKYQLENMKLDELPEVGAVLIVLPVRIQNAVEAPTRVLGVV